MRRCDTWLTMCVLMPIAISAMVAFKPANDLSTGQSRALRTSFRVGWLRPPTTVATNPSPRKWGLRMGVFIRVRISADGREELA